MDFNLFRETKKYVKKFCNVSFLFKCVPFLWVSYLLFDFHTLLPVFTLQFFSYRLFGFHIFSELWNSFSVSYLYKILATTANYSRRDVYSFLPRKSFSLDVLVLSPDILVSPIRETRSIIREIHKLLRTFFEFGNFFRVSYCT